MKDLDRSWELLRAHGRCTGASIFAVFGGCWFALAQVYFHRFGWPAVSVACGVASLLLLGCLRVARGQPKPVLGEELAEQKRRDDRRFGVINAVTYTLVFLLFLVLPRLGLQNYVFPAFAALVGLHFLPMAGSYRYRANVVTGLVMVGWAVFCAVWWREDGNRMAAFVALGSAGCLWCSSVAALLTARRLFGVAGGG